MRAVSMIFLGIGWAALATGTGYAAAPGQVHQEAQAASRAKLTMRATPEAPKTAASADVKAQRERRPSKTLASRGNSITHPASGPRNRTDAVRPAKQSHVNQRATAGRGRVLQQSSPPQPAGVHKSISMHSAGPNMVLAARSARTIQLNPQLSGSVQHRGANPPAIGGAATAHRFHSAAINGAEVRRKP